MSIFAEVGSSFQQIGGDCPEGWVVMQGGRPTNDHIADAIGSWVTAPVVIDPKLQGVEFEGVMCSATKEDMWGLASISNWIQAGNTTLFVFNNGSTLQLTPENYNSFYATWAAFRASFFLG